VWRSRWRLFRDFVDHVGYSAADRLPHFIGFLSRKPAVKARAIPARRGLSVKSGGSFAQWTVIVAGIARARSGAATAIAQSRAVVPAH